MIVGELAQKGAAAAGGPLRRWPRAALDAWGAWFLFALFFAILVWEEAWDLPQHAALSSWLLLLITAGATLGSVFYERRVWCAHFLYILFIYFFIVHASCLLNLTPLQVPLPVSDRR